MRLNAYETHANLMKKQTNPVRDSSSVEKGKSTTTLQAVRYADK